MSENSFLSFIAQRLVNLETPWNSYALEDLFGMSCVIPRLKNVTFTRVYLVKHVLPAPLQVNR